MGFLKFLFKIIKAILWFLLIVFLAIILVQRISDNKKSVAGIRLFTVISPSMVPEYEIGDSLLVKQVDIKDLKVGDDISYLGKEDTFKDKIVTHRIISINKDENNNYIIQTKGIANDKADPKINDTQIYGKVVYKIKTITKLNSIMGNLYGMYFVIVVPMAIIIIGDFIGNRRDKLEEKREKEKIVNDDEDNEEEAEDNQDEEKASKAESVSKKAHYENSKIQNQINKSIKKRREKRRNKSS